MGLTGLRKTKKTKMEFKEKTVIISKKTHACGGNEWSVERLGADVKLKCLKCGRSVFMSKDAVRKMAKEIKDNPNDGN